MATKFSSVVLAVVLVLLANVSDAQLIQNFGNCPELNNYYINNVLPFVGPRGLKAENAYTNTRRAPPVKAGSNKPGGPAGLKMRRLSDDPMRIASSNITSMFIDDEMAPDEDDGPVEGEDFSGTNTQVKGVDEPDIIKTDGVRVYTLSKTIFSVIQVLEKGAAGKRTGSLSLPTQPKEMLFEGDFVLAIGEDSNYKRSVYPRYRVDPSSGQESTVVYQIRISKDGKPTLVSTLHLEGLYLKSREVDGVVRLVLRHKPLSSVWLYTPSKTAQKSQTEKWNREIIQFSEAGNWLPTYQLKVNDGVQKGVYATCSDIFYSPTVFAGFNLLTVVTLPIAGRLSPTSSAAIISDADKVYANAETMYVTTSEYQFDDVSTASTRYGTEYQTSIHKFALSQTGADYVASGSVTGSVINQFAISEYEGTLFIATTLGALWSSTRDLSKSKVTAFQTNTKKRSLVRVGTVGNLGLGERIFSVRYIKDTAYVVTFQEIDPLYIIDLSDPTKMRVTGELKIPGFSTYLHPVGPGRLLGVGQDATRFGRPLGAKVSLFDVSDKSEPKELSVWFLKGSNSDAEWDHRAFLYWARERVAVMPVNVNQFRKNFKGAIVLDISPTEITERGRIVHKVPGKRSAPSIKRNAIIGQVHLWSMSDNLLQVNNIKDIEEVEDQVNISR